MFGFLYSASKENNGGNKDKGREGERGKGIEGERGNGEKGQQGERGRWERGNTRSRLRQLVSVCCPKRKHIEK